MRRTRNLTTTTLVVALLTGLSATMAAAPVSAEEPSPPAVSLPQQASPQAVLATAERVLEGDAAAGDPEPTMALLALRQVLTELPPAARTRAEALLARPDADTEGVASSGGTTNGRTAQRRARKCSPDFCLRYVTNRRSADHTSSTWAQRTFRTFKRVWRAEVDQMGYRAPLRDGGRDGRLDIYLKDIGDLYYGYCVPDKDTKRTSGYCVLDNDYDEFRNPVKSLKATAAHEFFHVVQYAYDSYEDPWFMESSSTWIEERVFDAVNDNRQYLAAGQIHRSEVPLDSFASNESWQYGNWVYLEHLSHRFGDAVIKQAWQLAGQRKHSLTALRQALRNRGGFVRTYARFAGENTHPASSYPEGQAPAYGRPVPARTFSLSAASPRAADTEHIDHLASTTWRVQPDPALAGRWRLRVIVDGPMRRTSPQLAVTVLRTDGTLQRRLVRLDRRGRGRTNVAFGAADVRDVSVTPVNASTRFRCRRETTYACGGEARDDGQRFTLRLRAFRR